MVLERGIGACRSRVLLFTAYFILSEAQRLFPDPGSRAGRSCVGVRIGSVPATSAATVRKQVNATTIRPDRIETAEAKPATGLAVRPI